MSIQEFVKIICVPGETPEGEHLGDHTKVMCYSFGMEKAERPDLLLRDVPDYLMWAAIQILNTGCEYMRNGPAIQAGQTIALGGQVQFRTRQAPINWRDNPYGLLELLSDMSLSCQLCGEEIT